MSNRIKVGILISGNGTNLQAIIDASQQDSFPAEIAIVISNNPSAYGLKRATSADIPTKVIDHKLFDQREDFDTAVSLELRKADCELICLAGFMRILSEQFVNNWPMRIINIHPSLLPSFKGRNVQKQAIDAEVRIAGCTVHFVISELDAGPIIAQAAIPVLKQDTPASLSARILQQENHIYPLALELIAKKIQGKPINARKTNTSDAEEKLISLY
ncbi:MAG: phosphoribosylglycinamide formyltransferase [Thalassobaculaceae bacterium]